MITTTPQQIFQFGDVQTTFALAQWPTAITLILLLVLVYALWQATLWARRVWQPQLLQLPDKVALPIETELNTKPKIVINVLGSHVSRKQRKAIIRQCLVDYKTARGYAHRILLEELLRSSEVKLNNVKKEQNEAETKLQSLEQQYNYELQSALEIHLLKTKMTEIPGIGEALQRRILEQTQARRLGDLERATTVSGVGEIRMNEVMRWVKKYRAMLPQLLNQPFPDSAGITKKFTNQIDAVKERLITLEEVSKRLQVQRNELEKRIAPLKSVSEKNFERAAFGSTADQAIVEQFQHGLFAEWEPVPVWFKALLKEEKQ